MCNAKVVVDGEEGKGWCGYVVEGFVAGDEVEIWVWSWRRVWIAVCGEEGIWVMVFWSVEVRDEMFEGREGLQHVGRVGGFHTLPVTCLNSNLRNTNYITI